MIGTILAPWHMVYRNSTNSYRAVKLRVMIGWDKREIEKWKGTSTLLILWVRLVTEISLWRNTWSRNVPGANKGVSWKSRHIEKKSSSEWGINSIWSQACQRKRKVLRQKEWKTQTEDIKKPLENEVMHYKKKKIQKTLWACEYEGRCERANTKDAVSVRMRKTLWECECERCYEHRDEVKTLWACERCYEYRDEVKTLWAWERNKWLKTLWAY